MYWYVLAGVVGACVGSFLSVVVARLGVRDGILGGRSECPNCHAVLAWYDLVPILSWLWLRGRCRSCHAPISWWYPVMEVVSAGALVAFFISRGLFVSQDSIVALVLVVLFLATLFFDARYHLLPSWFMVAGSAIALLNDALLRPATLPATLAISFLLALSFAILPLMSRERLAGWGDVILLFFIGSAFGFPGAIFVTVAAVWVGAIWGVALVAMGRATRTSAVPFGAFLSAAALVALLWPHVLISISNFFRW